MSASEETRLKAIAMLASGSTQAETAQECDVSERTIARWVRDPEFADQVEAQATAMGRAVSARLKSLAGAALESLGNIAVRGHEAKDRIAAAKAILDRVAPTKQDLNVTGKVETMTDEEIQARLKALGFEKKGA